MALTRSEMDGSIDEHFGYEARDDVDGVLATLDPDVEHDIVGWPLGPSHGRDATRAFYTALFTDLADGQVRNVRRLYGDNFMVDESVWSGMAVGRPFGIEGRGRPLEFRLLHVLEFADDGQIARIFQRSIAVDAFVGGIVGLALGLLAVFLLGRQFAALGSGMVTGGGLGIIDWIAIGAIPLAGVLIAMLTARVTVLAALRRML